MGDTGQCDQGLGGGCVCISVCVECSRSAARG